MTRISPSRSYARSGKNEKEEIRWWSDQTSDWLKASGYSSNLNDEQILRVSKLCLHLFTYGRSPDATDYIYNLNGRLKKALREVRSVIPQLIKMGNSIPDDDLIVANATELKRLLDAILSTNLRESKRRKSFSARWHDPAFQIAVALREATGEAGSWRRHPRVRFICKALPAIGFEGVSPDAVAKHLQRVNP